MTEYLKFEELIDPNYGGVKNNMEHARNTRNSGTQLFTYMKSCNNPDVQWGSNKPMSQTCLPNHQQMEGVPCTNIWNNSTKRKTIVDVNYNYPK